MPTPDLNHEVTQLKGCRSWEKQCRGAALESVEDVGLQTRYTDAIRQTELQRLRCIAIIDLDDPTPNPAPPPSPPFGE